MRSVILLLIALGVVACGAKETGPVTIHWYDNKAYSISIDRSLFQSEDIEPSLRVSGSAYDILGSFAETPDIIRFTPAVPLARGQAYDLFSRDDKIYSFIIPVDTTAISPVVAASFPSCDTVPENLLKMYLVFNQPMMEGRAYEHIHLFDLQTGDTIKAAFLDLQPELWSEDQRTLTLWLDPGRIKQDLIPNKELGAVLDKNKRYRLVVSPGWKSKSGLPLSVDYSRELITAGRDSGKPDVTTWNVTAGEDVVVDVHESLDWSLLNSVISVWGGDTRIEGTTNVQPCEKGFRFTPKEPLPPGTYRITIESRLEDLAGNNLTRLFETDVSDKTVASDSKPEHTIAFRVN